METSNILILTKYSWYLSCAVVFEFLAIPQMQIIILSYLMIIDFILWVWKQFRLDRKQITSHNAWLWLSKKICTFILVISIALLLKWLELEPTMYIKAAISILISAEFYSIIQNIYTIRTWKVVAEYDAISIFLKTLWEIIKKFIEKLINKI